MYINLSIFLYTNHIYYTFSFHHINNHQCIGLTPKCFQTRQFSNWDVYNLQAIQPILQLFLNTNHFHYTFSFHHINNHQCIGLTPKCFQTRQFSNRDLYNFQLFLHTNDFYIRCSNRDLHNFQVLPNTNEFYILLLIEKPIQYYQTCNIVNLLRWRIKIIKLK